MLPGLLVMAAGCSGTGTVKVVPLMRTDFTEVEPLIQNVPISGAYWDTDERGQVVVALKYHAGSVLGRQFDLDWQLSIVLEGLPAGSSRLYNLSFESVRMVQTCAGDQRRSRGWTGVAVLTAPKDKRLLRGRFHANVRQQQFTLLGGWSPHYYRAPLLVVVGEFEAVRDAKRALEIREATEVAGFTRNMMPTSRPSSMPMSVGIMPLPAVAGSPAR